MWGDNSGAVVYGFKETKRDAHIDVEWLEDRHLFIYGSYTVRDFLCGLIYGVKASFNQETGQATVTDLCKEFVMELATAMGREKDVKFYLAVSGGGELDGEEYIPDIPDDDEPEDEDYEDDDKESGDDQDSESDATSDDVDDMSEDIDPEELEDLKKDVKKEVETVA